MTAHALVATSDPASVGQFEGLLQDAGFAVQLVKDGAQALAVLDHECPAFLLVDLSLPKIDGFAVLTRLRQRYSDAKILVRAVENQRSKSSSRAHPQR